MIGLAGIAAFSMSGCRPRQGENPAAPLHLVIDAGSSGTRLCLFPIQRSCETPTGNCRCSAPPALSNSTGEDGEACQAIPDAGGLARMSPLEARAVLARAMQQLPQGTFGRIRNAVLLGTGGFRQIAAGERRAILESLAAQLQRELSGRQTATDGTEPISRARVLSGADEGRLAWLAMREIHGSQDHAILETGGASVQVAVSRRGAGGASGVRATSLPLGMNRAFDRLRSEAALPACFPFGAPDARTDFDRCRALIRRAIFNGQAADLRLRTANGNKNAVSGELFGLGSSWKAIFGGMRTRKISLSELLQFGRQVCAARKLTVQERSSKYLKRRCYLYAYQSIILEETGFNEIRRGSESWPRGAAVSEEFFPTCAGSRPETQ